LYNQINKSIEEKSVILKGKIMLIFKQTRYLFAAIVASSLYISAAQATSRLVLKCYLPYIFHEADRGQDFLTIKFKESGKVTYSRRSNSYINVTAMTYVTNKIQGKTEYFINHFEGEFGQLTSSGNTDWVLVAKGDTPTNLQCEYNIFVREDEYYLKHYQNTKGWIDENIYTKIKGKYGKSFKAEGEDTACSSNCSVM
jgi:hypothetical protein